MKKLKRFVVDSLKQIREHTWDAVETLTEEELSFVPEGQTQCIKSELIHIAETEDAYLTGVMLGQEFSWGARFSIEPSESEQLPDYADVKQYMLETRGNLLLTLAELTVMDFNDSLHVFDTGRIVKVVDVLRYLIEHSAIHLGIIRHLILLQGKTPPEVDL